MQVWSLGQEDPLEEEMVTHSSILAWRIPWTEQPGRLQSMGSKKCQTWPTFWSLSHSLETCQVFTQEHEQGPVATHPLAFPGSCYQELGLESHWAWVPRHILAWGCKRNTGLSYSQRHSDLGKERRKDPWACTLLSVMDTAGMQWNFIFLRTLL